MRSPFKDYAAMWIGFVAGLLAMGAAFLIGGFPGAVHAGTPDAPDVYGCLWLGKIDGGDWHRCVDRATGVVCYMWKAWGKSDVAISCLKNVSVQPLVPNLEMP